MENQITLSKEQMEQLNSGQPITIQPPQKYTYPMYFKSTQGTVVKFTSLCGGIAVEQSDNKYPLGVHASDWLSHEYSHIWTHLPDYVEDESFSCRPGNSYRTNTEGGIANFFRSSRSAKACMFQNTVKEASEFETLRKQLAIQFEFLKQHTYTKSCGPKQYLPTYNKNVNTWEVKYHQIYYAPYLVYMPKPLAQKFCNLANKGLIEGLTTPE